jgi:hypothetical protein
MKKLNNNSNDNDLNEFKKNIIKLNELLDEYNLIETKIIFKNNENNEIYNNENNNVFELSNSLLNNPSFLNLLHNILYKLYIFYNENNFIEEKYMMLIMNLFFGIINESYHNSKNLRNNKKNLFKFSFDISKLQESNLIYLFNIIIETLLKIKNFSIEYYTSNNESNSIDLSFIEYSFENEIKDYFYKNFSLFKHNIHKLIKILYNELEININENKDYVLFIKILIENKNNFKYLVINKYLREIEKFNINELTLLNLYENIDFNNEFDILKLIQKLKSLIYLKNQKFYNNGLITNEDIIYINKHYLKNEIKINNINDINKNNLINNDNNSNDEKEIIRENLNIIKNNIEKINWEFNNDINQIKEEINFMQNKYKKNLSKLNENIKTLELKLEKINNKKK